jgi:PAS domain S-box-containing protein
LSVLIVLFIVASLSIGVMALRSLESRLVMLYGQILAAVSNGIADQLSWILYERYGDVRMMAVAPVFRGDDHAAMRRHLMSLQLAYPVYAWLGVTDASGRLVAATESPSGREDRSGAAWFRSVRDCLCIRVLDAAPGVEVGGAWVVTFAAPLRGARGEFLGVIAALVGVNGLEDALRPVLVALESDRAAPPMRLEYQFVKRDGVLVADSRLREEGTANVMSAALRSATMGVSDQNDALGFGFVEERYERRGMEMVTGYAQMRDVGAFDGPRWLILVRVDRGDVLDAVRRTTQVVAMGGAVVIAPLCGLLAWSLVQVRTTFGAAQAEAERARTAESRIAEQNRALSAIEEASRNMAGRASEDLEQCLSRVVELARALTGAAYGALGVFDETGQRLARFLAFGIDEEIRQAIGAPPIGRGLLGLLLREEDVLRLKDLTQHPAFSGFPPGHPPMRSFLGVGIRRGGQPLGTIYLADKCRAGIEEFTDLDVQTVKSLAAHAAAAIENHRLMGALREAEARHRLLLESASEGIIGVDADGRCTFINDAGAALLAGRREDFMGQDAHGLLHRAPEQSSPECGDACALRRVPQTREPSAAQEDLFRRADGSELSVEYCAASLVVDGCVHGAVVIFRDITERKQAEAEFLAHLRQLQYVVELGRLALAGADPDDLMRDAVARAASAIEVPYGEIVTEQPGGTAWRVRAGVGWREGYVGRTLAVGDVDPAIITLLRSGETDGAGGGASEEVSFQGAPALRDHGVVSGVRALIRGVDRTWGVLGVYADRPCVFTRDDRHYLQVVANVLASAMDRRQAEEALRRSEAQFHQAQKMEAIGSLAGGIAHDFNNMLTVILGYSGLALASMAADDPQRDNLVQIKEAGQRAATLTRQLLAFSRKQVLQPRVLDLNAVVTNMDKMLQRLIGENIALATALTPGLGRVKADAGQLEQVLMNLAVNARDAMPQGGRLTIETANVEMGDAFARTHIGSRPGPYVMLAVRDTGCGMDAATQARIFEPFFTTKEKGKGTGLGLATVYGIIKQSGGGIWVSSEVGVGTTFTVYLPRVEEALDAVGPSLSPEADLRGSEIILLAEDEAGVRALARAVLRARGYQVLEAPSGEDAVRLSSAHEGAIHLLLTDMVMTGMSGCELAERLRAARPEMKALIMSGYMDQAIVRNGVLEGGAAFLPKPFTPLVLLQKVREVLDSPNKMRNSL